MQEQFTVEDMVKAITQSRGLLTHAADALGCSRMTIYNYAKEYPEVQAAIDSARDRMTDVAEGKLFQKISEGDNTALIFYLKTQGKKRGYVERQEVTGAEGGELTVRVVREDE